jgi:hypothetical protein
MPSQRRRKSNALKLSAKTRMACCSASRSGNAVRRVR